MGGSAAIRRMSLPRASALLVGLLALSVFLTAPDDAASGEPYPSLFGTDEKMHAGIGPFRKWATVLDRYYGEERPLEAEPCESGIFKSCDVKEWRDFLGSLADSDFMDQLAAVNDFINGHAYRTDPVNWRRDDYWAVPREFLTRDGDCEDYAIAKYFSLRHLGVPSEQMRIVVLHDEALRTAHAILVVYVDRQALVLDNQIRRIVSTDRIGHYRPIFSLNETNWWLHAKKRPDLAS